MTIINVWHIIEGKWMHLTQVEYHDKVVMFVDGKLSGKASYGKDL